ncbi:hypothetical protein HY612_00390 [Candidatus Roizmanbacteria bacterium]|nr:hypothetical protein [Candidatus Roizmanbacteria bacterium]
MNIPITIPKEITKGEELVIIPRKVYEEFKRILKIVKIPSKSLELRLDKAVKEVKQGKIVGPFTSTKDLMKSLRSNK